MQNWDETLFPPFLATIHGTYYGVISQDELDEECFNLAKRAIMAFKFPKISTEYTIFYATRDEDGELIEVEPEQGIPHGRFINDLGNDEIEVLVAWMKVYWAEMQLSDADNYTDMYTDVNIKTFSRANAIEKNTSLLKEFRSYARDLETRYSRITTTRKPSIGDINEEN